ncbi:MAG: cytochrome c family protein [Planctomycetia bacterium]|nr:cytochrome c family protein [Planctomycetia bacterium]
MTAATVRVRLIAAAFFVAGGVVLYSLASYSAAPAHAAQQDPPAPVCEYLKVGPAEKTAGKISPGIALCVECHGENKAKTFREKFQSEKFILLNEGETWTDKDVHSIAMKALSEPLGLEMEKLMIQSKLRPASYKVAEAPECLTCHSADLSPTKKLADKKLDDFATFAGGVNCTVCHGLHRNWQLDHVEEPKQKGDPPPWRARTPEYKYLQGMNDLRNPVVKAQLCVSCHVGNVAEGKVVTHDMYAVGHPPLPPFELASFMEGEPKHWAYPTELPYFADLKPEQIWKLFHFHPAKEESYLSRHYAVGAIATLQAEADLLLAEAKRAEDAKDIMDYARFDCYACHHDLKYPSDRQKRGFAGPPGRPPLRAASGIPAGIVAKHAEGIEEGGLKEKAAGFAAKWSALQDAATAKVFGDPKKVQAAATEMRKWCDDFLKVQCEFEKPLYTPKQALRLHDMLAKAAVDPKVLGDPEAAMCLTWGYLTLGYDGKLNFPAEKMKALEEVFSRNVRVAPFSIKVADKMEPIPVRYIPRMKQLNAFESKKFVNAFEGIIQPK